MNELPLAPSNLHYYLVCSLPGVTIPQARTRLQRFLDQSLLPCQPNPWYYYPVQFCYPSPYPGLGNAVNVELYFCRLHWSPDLGIYCTKSGYDLYSSELVYGLFCEIIHAIADKPEILS
jgi:hypothetical protein